MRVHKPHWLKRPLPKGSTYEEVKRLLHKGRLHTVCQEAKCPNIWECFSNHTSTFLIMGPCCTRRCRFCAVEHGPLDEPDPEEPTRIADAVQDLGLRYVVVTSVTRDDLPDGGAGHFAKTIKAIRERVPDVLVEVLIPDFQGDKNALSTVLDARPDVLNHNIETVPRLYPSVRPEALYNRSIELLREVDLFDDHRIPAKSGMMLGLGETCEEVKETLRDLLSVGCRILTLGQYLQPTKEHLPVDRYIPPEEFENWKEIAIKMGFTDAAGGPFVRSSYHARELYQNVMYSKFHRIKEKNRGSQC
ncbi:MAG: lipoyl synthase [bacterium]